MVHMGIDGYTASCREIVGATKKIVAAIKSDFPELYILGDPKVSVVAFGSRSNDLPVYEVGDRMGKLGWHCAFSFSPFLGNADAEADFLDEDSECASVPPGAPFSLHQTYRSRRGRVLEGS